MEIEHEPLEASDALISLHLSNQQGRRESAIRNLEVIAASIRRTTGTSQRRRLINFLASLYDGALFQFDLTDLRALDDVLAEACLAVLSYDRYASSEIHNWGVIDGRELERWLHAEGLRYQAERRRLADVLYFSEYGPEGHPDGRAS